MVCLACRAAGFHQADYGVAMSQQPYMKLWVSDFLGDTLQLTPAEVGQYMLILMAMWNNGGSLPKTKINRVARSRVSDEVMTFFDVDGDQVTNKRLTAELQNAQRFSDSQRQKANAKHLKDKEQASAGAVPNVCHHSHSQLSTESERVIESVGGAKAPAYAWCGQVIKLNAKHLADWTKAYSHLDLPAELTAYDEYLREQGVTKNWFARTSQHFANRNMKAKAHGMARSPPRFQTRQEQLQQAISEHLEEVDAAFTSDTGSSRRAICGARGEYHPEELHASAGGPEGDVAVINGHADWISHADPVEDA
jgi:uncharacterized protein YdaU (DUF1376 family)